MLAPTLMVQGTASSVGKSLLVTALCRIYARRGLRVAPFKAQNMALNSAVTPDGLEIGRAQAVQAEAAGTVARIEMNPILLKPESERGSQVVVLGKPRMRMQAAEYHEYKPQLERVVADSLAQLRSEYDLVIIEGAGSPAEINLRSRDLVNMHVARLADAPVLLAGDIDRGGVFAAFVGTLELLEPDERARIVGFVVNKFRGDVELLRPGLDMLTARTGKPVLGVVPFVSGLRIADEDSLSLEERMRRRRPEEGELDIVVVRLPRISNYDDVIALEREPGVVVRFVQDAREVAGADLAVLPGSKSTIADLAWLREQGIDRALRARAERRAPVLGICGGCQMLGELIEDPQGVESQARSAPGLGLLPLRTRFAASKLTAQVRASSLASSFLSGAAGDAITGYEIHMGEVTLCAPGRSLFAIERRNGQPCEATDGAVDEAGTVAGTMIHGLLDNHALRAALLTTLRARRGLPTPASQPAPTSDYDRLADTVEPALSLDHLDHLINRDGPA